MLLSGKVVVFFDSFVAILKKNKIAASLIQTKSCAPRVFKAELLYTDLSRCTGIP